MIEKLRILLWSMGLPRRWYSSPKHVHAPGGSRIGGLARSQGEPSR
jgi:hypothetical protein